MATKTKSPFREMFGTEELKAGARPGAKAMFPAQGDKNIETAAKTRALAVLRYRHEDELREVYLAECEYLKQKEKVNGNSKSV